MVVIENGEVKIPIKIVGEATGGSQGSSKKGSTKGKGIEDLTQDQLSNITDFATNPQGFVLRNVFGRFKGLGAGALAVTALFGAIQLAIDILTADGMPFDRRFKLIIDKRVQRFMDNQLRADISLGKKSIRVSAYPSPKGGFGIVGSNLEQIKNGQGIKIYDDTEAKGVFTRLN